MDELLAGENQQDIYRNRQNGTRAIISEAVESFKQAISNLNLSRDELEDMERSLLDTAIFIALSILELQLYERIIDGKDINSQENVNEEIQNGNWSSFVKNKAVLSLIGKIKKLEEIQFNNPDREGMLSQEFANKNRRGLRVTTVEFCKQYESYCKGFYLHQCGFINEAVTHYSISLSIGGQFTDNRLRLMALEAIELIISEKYQLEK